MQRIFLHIIFLGALVFAVSCKSVSKITNKDNSANTNNRSKKKRKVEFIDGIEITPGSVVKSKHKPATTKVIGDNSIISIPTDLDKANIKSIAEKATRVQYKYAIMLDTYLENISNKLLYETIDDWMGTSYCYGGTSKNCIDCSAFTGMLFRTVYKIDLARNSHEQYNQCTKTNKSSLKEGDLVFFATRGSGISHVGVYLHNNKFVHASTSGGVMINDLDDKYWGRKFYSCGRVGN